ncbi:MAG: TetR/AcrR family transcriptional regulator [Jatrophihabitans sp.]|uniref:TetR/AcrR family transcriptional regulator n=1 Tax=Jatrophihabitans sp. TaxID=1932789 RepID=UPI003F7E4D09
MKVPVTRLTPRAQPRTAGRGERADGAPVDGRSARWAAHRAARRDDLIDAVVSAVRQYGTDVGMDQIAAVAHTSKPVIYRYFADKNDLYGAVGRKVISEIVAALPVADDHTPPRSIFQAWVDAYLTFLSEQTALYHFIERHQPTTAQTEEVTDPNRLMAEAIALQLGNGLALVGSDPALAHPWAEATVGFVRAAGLWWLENPAKMDRAVLGDYLTTLLWDGGAGIYRVHGKDLPPPFRPA